MFSDLEAESGVLEGDFSVGFVDEDLQFLIGLRAASVEDDGRAGEGSAKDALRGDAEVVCGKAELALSCPLDELVGVSSGDFAVVRDERAVKLHPVAGAGDVQAVSVLRAVQRVGEAEVFSGNFPGDGDARDKRDKRREDGEDDFAKRGKGHGGGNYSVLC